MTCNNLNSQENLDDVKVLDEYSRAFRDLINEKVLPSKKSIKETLRLNKDDDWNFLCSAMDIIGGSSAALENFLRFGLDGPTRYNDVGEKHLRLYGALNATYMQQKALLKLYKLTNAPDLKETQAQIHSLGIREVRNKFGAHSIDFSKDRKTKQTESYAPAEVSLSGFRFQFFNQTTKKVEEVDLQESLDEHLKAVINSLDCICEKTINTLYRGDQKHLDEWNKKLEILRIKKGGGIVAPLPNGSKLVRR